jgi:hypothetical protein
LEVDDATTTTAGAVITGAVVLRCSALALVFAWIEGRALVGRIRANVAEVSAEILGAQVFAVRRGFPA